MGRLFFDIRKCAGGAYEEKSIAAIYYDRELLWPVPLVLSEDIIEADDVGGEWTVSISGLDNPSADNYTVEGAPDWVTIDRQNGQFTVSIEDFSETDEIREAQLIVRSVENPAVFDVLDIVQQGAYRVELTFETTEPDTVIAMNGIAGKTVRWGDGDMEVYAPHTYSQAGTYNAYIYGMTNIQTGFCQPVGENLKYARLCETITGNLSNSAFGNCVNLKVADMSKSKLEAFVQVYPSSNYPFKNCPSLETIVLPDTWTSIDQGNNGQGYFPNLPSLKNINFPSSLTGLIGQICFINDEAIELFDFSKTGLTGINSYSYPPFNGTTSMKIVKLPTTWTQAINFNGNVFYKASITDMYFYNINPVSIQANAFNSTCVIHVPWSSDHSVLNAYQTATNWVAYASRIVEFDAENE